MSRKKCKCCENNSKEAPKYVNGWGYNKLDGENREWAKKNRVATSEHCVPVKGGKKFAGPLWLKQKCGDGTKGFSTRKDNDEVRIEIGMDGQYKKKRHTVVNKRSSKSTSSKRPRRIDGSKFSMASSAAIKESAQDPKAKRAKRKLAKMNSGKRKRMSRVDRKRRAQSIKSLQKTVREYR